MQTEQFQLHCEIEQRHWWFVARRQILRDLVRELVPPQPDVKRRATVIDVGCGTGANAASLADQYHSVGIDTSAEAIRLAAQRFPQVDFRAGFAPGDLGDCLGTASLVMLNDVLEHVPDDFQLLSSLLAATRSGTYFLVTVPADMGLWSGHDESFGHYRRYDAGRLAQVWEGLPVDTLLLSYFNARLYPIIRWIRDRNRRRGRTSGQAGTDFSLPVRPVNWLLAQVFSGERHRLRKLMSDREAAPYPAGASLLAILRRQGGSIDVRERPDSVPADLHHPGGDLQTQLVR